MAFRFKQFSIDDSACAMKIGTDSVLLGSWVNLEQTSSIIDLGCGSGILMLMCAQRQPQAHICGVEIDEAAFRCAQANIAASPWWARCQLVCADAIGYHPAIVPDLIISNPPYFEDGLLSPDSQRAQARHAQGLSAFSVIDYAARWLAPAGSVALIAPVKYQGQVIYRAEMSHLKLRRQCSVSTSPRRQPSLGMWQFSRIDGPIVVDTLSIGDDRYCKITSPFYL